MQWHPATVILASADFRYSILTYFSVNLSEARETALLESVYTHTLTRVYLRHPQLMELRELVLRVHCDRVAAIPNGHAVLFPYFEGYCGTPSSGLVQSQQSGVMRNAPPHRRFSAMHIPMRQKRVRRPSASSHIASRSHVDEVASLSMTEQEILQSLVEGKGITKYEHIGLLKVCGSCQQTFAASALRAHIVTCSEG
ncbi:hypothetical protein DFH29DRAFT_881565 [Suillus ampliporus]|nr:hypothetical protein DFH29DRAFT_881565 [Suillus ampliporus]